MFSIFLLKYWRNAFYNKENESELVMFGSSADVATLRQLIHFLSVLNFQSITVIMSYWLNPTCEIGIQ